MKKILMFKNPCLTQDEAISALDIIKELSLDDFDKVEYLGKYEYYYMTESLEVELDLSILEKLSEVFSAVILEGNYIKIKNKKGDY